MKIRILAGVASIALAAVCATGSTASAQAMFDWSGFYVGANAGYGWGRSEVIVSGHDTGWSSQYQSYLASLGRVTLNPNGALGGIQVGHNSQRGNFLWGIEGDAQYMRLKASRDTGTIPGPFPADPDHNARLQESVEAKNFYTLRLRAGIAADSALVYATGGLAVTQFEFWRDIFFQSGPTNYIGSESSWRLGWTAGGGFEYAFAPNWSVKAEYLYADFGSVGFRVVHPTISTIFIDSKATLSTHILRIGVNRKL